MLLKIGEVSACPSCGAEAAAMVRTYAPFAVSGASKRIGGGDFDIPVPKPDAGHVHGPGCGHGPAKAVAAPGCGTYVDSVLKKYLPD